MRAARPPPARRWCPHTPPPCPPSLPPARPPACLPLPAGTGGSNGATMRFSPEASHGANAGLKVARDLLEGVKKEFPEISYADLWSLAGVVAIQEMVRAAERSSPLAVLAALRNGNTMRQLLHRALALTAVCPFPPGVLDDHDGAIAGRPRDPLAPRPRGCRLREGVHPRRPPARCPEGRRPHPRHLRAHGVQRPGDRRAVGRPRAGPVPHHPQRVHGPLDARPHDLLQRVLPPAAGGEVGREDARGRRPLEGPQAVHRRQDG